MKSQLLNPRVLFLLTIGVLICAFPFTQRAQDSNQFRSNGVEVVLSNAHWENLSNIEPTDGGLSLKSGKDAGELILNAISIPLDSPEPSLSIAADWSAEMPEGSGVELAIRGSENKSSWGPWRNFVVDEDARTAQNSRASGFLFFGKDTKFVELRVSLVRSSTDKLSPVLKQLRLTFFCSGISSKTVAGTQVSDRLESQMYELAEAIPPKPPIVSRINWGCPDGESAPRVEAQYISYPPVRHIIIHHTVSDNSSTDWPEVVRGIWFQHTFPQSLINPNGKNYGDIGYNYLIDPNGVIYEGRAGGDDIEGFHFCHANTGTMGVGMLGTFTSELPTAQALISLKKLLAWKAAQSQINPLGIAVHDSILLPVIAGHRDGCEDQCPGDSLYGVLSSIRNGVSNLIGYRPGNFVGNLDVTACDAISGWVADVNNLITSLDVEILDGNTVVATVHANQVRPDVGGYLGDNGHHGFNTPTPASLKDGRPHSISVRVLDTSYFLNASGRSITCGASTTTNYAGSFDVADCSQIYGWAADRNRPSTPINVSIYDGSTLLQTVLANGSRPDVGNYLGDNGLHGFTITTPASLKNGQSHSLSVKFESSSTNLDGSSKTLACGTSTTPNYTGYLDFADCNQIYGWAADKNRLNTPINVSIYDGNTLVTTVTANGLRADVGSFLGDNGLHGFTIPTPQGLKNNGAHTITAKFESSNTNLGNTKTVNCVTVQPVYEGYHDAVDCDFIRGWAWDQNQPNTPINVDIYDGSTLIGTASANQFRSDLTSKGNGFHAFNFSTPSSLKNGSTHTITVKFGGTNINLNTTPKPFGSTCQTAIPPTAAFTINGGGNSGGNGQTLNFLVPVGGSINFSFNGSNSTPGTGSITSYEWRISTTFLSSSQSFNYTLGHGSHFVELKVTNSSGLTNTANATIVINEVPRIDSISPTNPTHSGVDQDISIFGLNFQFNLTVAITFPNGGGTTLSGTQIRNVTPTSFVMRATLGSAGFWKIQVNNPDGGQSNLFTFTVR